MEVRLGAGRVAVVRNRGFELALEVVDQRDLGIDRAVVVGEVARLLLGGRGIVLVDDVDERPLGGTRGAVRVGEVAQLVGNRAKVRHVVGFLVEEPELAVCLCVVALADKAGDVGGREARDAVRVGGLRVVGHVRVIGGVCRDLGCRCLKAQAVGARAAKARLLAVGLTGDVDGLGALGVHHRHVANGQERKLEALLVGVSVRVPAGADDVVPGGALEALRHLDRGRAARVVGVGKDWLRGADGLPATVRILVVVADIGGNGAAIGLGGVDAHPNHVGGIGHATVGVSVARRDAHGRTLVNAQRVKLRARVRRGRVGIRVDVGERVVRAIGHMVVEVGLDPADAKGAHLSGGHLVELGRGVALAIMLAADYGDFLFELVVEVGLPSAVGLLDEVVLRELNRAKGNRALRGNRGGVARLGLPRGACGRGACVGRSGACLGARHRDLG